MPGRRERAPAPIQPRRFLRLGFSAHARGIRTLVEHASHANLGLRMQEGNDAPSLGPVEEGSDMVMPFMHRATDRARFPGGDILPERAKESTVEGTAVERGVMRHLVFLSWRP